MNIDVSKLPRVEQESASAAVPDYGPIRAPLWSRRGLEEIREGLVIDFRNAGFRPRSVEILDEAKR
jgi:hypothetical protein